MRRGTLCTLLALVCLLVPSAAHASTVSAAGATLTYTAAANETNFVTFSVAGANIHIFEALSSGATAPTLTVGAGCVSVDAKNANCPSAGLTTINASANDLNDSFTNSTSLAGTFDGNAGNDSFDSTSPQNETFNGGGDPYTGPTGTGDKVGYQLAPGPTGVTVTLVGGNATVTVAGLGTDTYTGVAVIDGSPFADTLTGDVNNNQIFGNGGNDILSSGAGNDNIQGGSGDDTFDGGPGSDGFQDTGGVTLDTVTYANEPAGVTATPAGAQINVATSTGTDAIFDPDNITGSPFADSLAGDAAVNRIDGGAGNDLIRGGAGNDVLTGGANTDTVIFDDLASPVAASLTTNQAIAGAETDTLAGFENLTGGAGADTLVGDAGANVLTGGGGTDTVTYQGVAAAVTADTSAGTATGASSGNDTLTQVESLIGTAFADSLKIRDGAQGDLACGGGADLGTTDANDTFQPDCETVAPVATGAPALTGAAGIGNQLTLTPGSWGGTASTVAYEWQRCDSTGAGCAAIPGATTTTYTVDPADAGHRLRARVTAANAAGTGAAQTGTSGVVQAPAASAAQLSPTAPAPAQPSAGLPDPVFARTANAEPVSGTVLVKTPGSAAFVPLTEPTQIAFGSIIDARNGRVRLTTIDAKGRKQSAEFYEGMFKLLQQKSAGGITELVLFGGSFKGCPKSTAARSGHSSAKRKGSSSVRHLWGSGKGLFRTKGRYSSATIRGTTWLTDDRCNGTLTRVKQGAVTVKDFPHKKTFALKAPKKYLAAPRP